MTPRKLDWTVDKIATALTSLSEDVGKGHSRLVKFMLEEAERKVPGPRHLSTFDDFADMKSIVFDPKNPSDVKYEDTMEGKFKQHSGEHGKSRSHAKRVSFPVTRIKSDKESVPRYRFHHVEIRKNILAPNSMLNFVPHLRDVDPNSAEEKKYANWLIELENLDTSSGFKTLNRAQKVAKRAQNEYAATLSVHLDSWLRKLDIDGCTKSTLIRYMASQPESDDAITPQQKTDLLDTYSEGFGSPQVATGAKLFTEAFDRVFNNPKRQRRITLFDVLKLDKLVEPILDNKRAKDTPSSQRHQNKELMPKVVEALASYSTLGCLICFSHDCEHGEIERDNQKRCFSLDETGGVARTLREKWAAQLRALGSEQKNNLPVKATHQPCRNGCYRSNDTGKGQVVEPWDESESTILEQVFATIGHSTSLSPQCFVAAVLGRPCWDVHRKFKQRDLAIPTIEPRTETQKVKVVSWYDRKKKQLLGDWQDSTVTHEHSLRELFQPCHHDGPCTAANKCPCASAGIKPILCERFCQCTAEECPLKFTGCACHSLGKTCVQRQKEGKPCICVQLNRECDPVLCTGCGAKDRADPENAYDEKLHSTGCQNVPMQRGATKAVVIGSSQLEACGYGLFAAENIAQDEFIIEYTGELISHDEGVRRENRRGDVFDEENKVSYLFTLLEQEGIWVDAAIYGNLSRYINHANDTCNITPKIMYVNHEFRIKFSALKDIKAGEELFFNYGDNFPNLTKKLVESREGNGEGGKSSAAAQKRKNAAQRNTARKSARVSDDDDDMADDWQDNMKLKKKRGGKRPGAGRKKKSEDNTHADRHAEISDSQGESVNYDTPTRRRARNSGAGLFPPLGTPGQDQMKKPSKRGGARPGAGRKPKHRPATATKSNKSKQAGNDNDTSPNSNSEKSNLDAATNTAEDSDDIPLIFGDRHRAGPSNLARELSVGAGATGAGKKRKASEFEADTGSVDSNEGVVTTTGARGPYREDVFQPIDSDPSIRGGDDIEEDDDFEDDDGPSSRKRQKPMRYRDEKE
ncbi:hypothetical protein QBC35DRAFT_372947 [Podospora australis]|uniref:SET domain-containing protein n=1 Tax=Podospora australis TaxID=1536484 RepID=A0AAN7AN39_9PEZI|nr:hypothetical protein QBC35DRAFT_372947 [Podospora australis]